MNEQLLGGQCPFCHKHGEHAADCTRPRIADDAATLVKLRRDSAATQAITAALREQLSAAQTQIAELQAQLAETKQQVANLRSLQGDTPAIAAVDP